MVGGGLIALGILTFFSGGTGLWTAAIGFMILQAAKAEQRRVTHPAFRIPLVNVMFAPGSAPFGTPTTPGPASGSPFGTHRPPPPRSPFGRGAFETGPIETSGREAGEERDR